MEREEYKVDKQMEFVQIVKNEDKNKMFNSLKVHETMMAYTE